MARVPTIEESSDARTRELIERLRKGRRGSLLGLYKALLHNGKIAETWFNHLNAVRWETGLSGRLREILIIRVGWRLGCGYILKQHIPKLAAPEGLDAALCLALQTETPREGFSALELAAIDYADELTLRAKASDEVATRLKAGLGDAGLVEATVLIGTYNMHARVIGGLDIGVEKG